MMVVNIITSIATVVLVVVTAVYAYFTGKMLSEMRKTREAEIKPALEAFTIPFGPTNVVLEIRNTGKGPARKITMKYKYESSDEERKWGWSVLSPEESKRFSTPDGNLNLENLANSNKKLIVELKYKDLLDKIYKKTFIIDFSQIKAKWHNSDMLLEEGMQDNIKKINKNLKDISKSFTPFGLKIKKDKKNNKNK